MAPTATFDISGNLLGDTTNADGFNPAGTVVFDLATGTTNPPQQLEVMSQDLGNVAAGFINNFAYGTLELTTNGYVELVDDAVNSPGDTPKAFYVNTLIVPAGATLNLNGLHVYANSMQIKGTITGGVLSSSTDEWISTSSGNWNDANDWSTGAVPAERQRRHRRAGGHADDHDQLGHSVGPFHHGQRSDLDHRRLADRRGELDDRRRLVDDRRFAHRQRGRDDPHGHGDDDGLRGEPLRRGGATLSLPDLTSYTQPNNAAVILQATGTGSVLALPDLASISLSNGRDLRPGVLGRRRGTPRPHPGHRRHLWRP